MLKKYFTLTILVCVLLVGAAIISSNNSLRATPVTSTDDWQNIQGEGVSLLLPPGYEGGNPGKDIDEIAERIEAIAPKYRSRVEAIKQNATEIALVAYDTRSVASGLITNVNIIEKPAPEGLTLEQYLETLSEKLSPPYQIEEREIISLSGYWTGRAIAELETDKIAIKQLLYIIRQNEETYWIVTYSTTKAEFSQRLADFETSIQTFQVQ